jgi:hypothetical protein
VGIVDKFCGRAMVWGSSSLSPNLTNPDAPNLAVLFQANVRAVPTTRFVPRHNGSVPEPAHTPATDTPCARMKSTGLSSAAARRNSTSARRKDHHSRNCFVQRLPLELESRCLMPKAGSLPECHPPGFPPDGLLWRFVVLATTGNGLPPTFRSFQQDVFHFVFESMIRVDEYVKRCPCHSSVLQR